PQSPLLVRYNDPFDFQRDVWDRYTDQQRTFVSNLGTVLLRSPTSDSLSKIRYRATRYRATYHLYPRTKHNSAGREGCVKKSHIGCELA
ncbi:hypothetical protein A2U01_0045661, partial [Trifolium medium]|nr:hypothetical protein [Trifolium medium]